MARFDVYRIDETLLLDVQADSLPYLKTRLVVPLYPIGDAPRLLIATLNPTFQFGDDEVAMLTQYAAAVSDRDLGIAISSLATQDYAIGRALDMLLTGI